MRWSECCFLYDLLELIMKSEAFMIDNKKKEKCLQTVSFWLIHLLIFCCHLTIYGNSPNPYLGWQKSYFWIGVRLVPDVTHLDGNIRGRDTVLNKAIPSSRARYVCVCVCVHLASPLLQSLNALTGLGSLEDQSDEPLTSGWPTRQARSRRDPSVHLCDALMQVLAVLVYPKRMYRRPSGIIPIWRLSCVSGVKQGCGGGGGWGKGLLAWLQLGCKEKQTRL